MFGLDSANPLKGSVLRGITSTRGYKLLVTSKFRARHKTLVKDVRLPTDFGQTTDTSFVVTVAITLILARKQPRWRNPGNETAIPHSY
ncbi:hypothetical protein EVAR_66167_1 [Eumeta japonica]|uniref:Uncharacterized protein n=1 Tax=Eumeta variegata TaxID=151549 RepID=A0A4C1ZJY7_EUMVA|nr:hypothetical protein EVAR_66167_1 [Eumeta japonica]